MLPNIVCTHSTKWPIQSIRLFRGTLIYKMLIMYKLKLLYFDIGISDACGSERSTLHRRFFQYHVGHEVEICATDIHIELFP